MGTTRLCHAIMWTTRLCFFNPRLRDELSPPWAHIHVLLITLLFKYAPWTFLGSQDHSLASYPYSPPNSELAYMGTTFLHLSHVFVTHENRICRFPFSCNALLLLAYGLSSSRPLTFEECILISLHFSHPYMGDRYFPVSPLGIPW